MGSQGVVGFSDADSAAMADILHAVEREHAAVALAQARLTRALGKAERLADELARGASAKVRERDMARRAIAAELAVPLHLSDRSVQRQMSEAGELLDDYPATLDAWESGRITRGHVRVIVETGASLPPEARHEFEAQALPRCEADTAGRVRSGLQILAQRMHPRTLSERHVDANERRGVAFVPLSDGMCQIVATLPAVLGEGIHDRLTRQAAALRDEHRQAKERLASHRAGAACGDAASGAAFDADRDASGDVDPCDIDADEAMASDARTAEQIRADIFADMLLTAQPGSDPTASDDGPGTLGAIRAHIQVVVPVLTAVGHSDAPAELVGRGPVDAHTARTLLGASCKGCDRLMTDPVTGQVLATDHYQRTADQRRFLRGRDRHCRFPGCRVPALRCEHDHSVDYARGGPTCITNLAGLCQRHHSMKQFTAWQVRQIGNGVLEWRSPLGRIYIDHPPAVSVQFTLDGDPPPF
jgi:hypothetical protein